MGDLMFRPHLADTLELIARKGPDVLYKGSLGKVLVDDITLNGGIMTMEDLKNYRYIIYTFYVFIQKKNLTRIYLY